MQQVTVVFRDGVRKSYGDLRDALRTAWLWRQLDEAEQELYRCALIRGKMLHPRNKRKK